MVGKDSDDNIQKITKLLEKGGTMLATHHECGAPMFRYQGKIICPVCDSQEKKQIVEPQETGKTETEKQQIDRIKQGQQKKNLAVQVQIAPQSADISQISEINDIIINKVRELAASLENEAEIARIKDKMECIEQGLKILKLLREQE
ncbi:MAG: hypothetical protein MPEBLZ_01525 [Candidatus Methanoperedens nitroreducens]|uniref:Sjogren's syndrome/scleroderma autoantigen 1 (Autoantigen p27) n=1 Tax=Candidatus Methanoperedens nitratireducens TaxID=1392998 RepID=A0A0P8AB74_9EURY|nr:Sjogren's syndrome/scleroderma autoantigen 1 family protein [Candidatus Methanoperedens sp. BLZ2]KAB2943414.1 MAG: hypothetical protein F9K14_15835 [Candidatus Methanoperedens sp.]KPQ43878.1 MAG: hypothetical protein MPEBLZ_01525 [Candidatus Methanoperedens sp. BLZ1]MBZ0176434.1 hypothetical protein [Candidatus Methanoperedens nitroreducens]CAG0990050.1 hypothetical protein METP2_02520 [Methanosarcinales archaeon]MCX9078627.1 hypothetical protein [Candidatus Methanoperedens sp.]